MGGFSFPKRERLSRKRDITELFDDSQGGFVFPFKYLFRVVPTHEDRQVGDGEQTVVDESGVAILVSVSKKYHKRAVRRNLIKRRTREAYRLKSGALREKAKSGGAKINLALIYSSKEVLDYKTVEDAIRRIIEKIGSGI